MWNLGKNLISRVNFTKYLYKDDNIKMIKMLKKKSTV